MADNKALPVTIDPSVDPYGYLQFTQNSDGSATRLPFKFPETPADDDPSSAVLTKDFPVNQSKSTYLRLYLPRQAVDNSSTTTDKLPFIIHFHGGGFVICSAATTVFHTYCTTIATGIPAVIASIEYRLSPEHRLPAAYDDAVEALHWIKTTKEELFVKYADLSNCFFLGDSAGANIAYNAGLRVAAEDSDFFDPLKIIGLILYHPFFGGTERMQSEIKLVNDKVLPQVVSDLMWDLALPAGADRDHEYCNPIINGGSDLCDKIGVLGWKVLVTGVDGDPLFDRQVAFGEMLEKRGVKVMKKFGKGECHGADIVDPSKTGSLVIIYKEFLSSFLQN